ncbi:MAG: WD40 repeat domain-containing protein [Myxococcota bacterium]
MCVDSSGVRALDLARGGATLWRRDELQVGSGSAPTPPILLEDEGLVLVRPITSDGLEWLDWSTGARVGEDAECCYIYHVGADGSFAMLSSQDAIGALVDTGRESIGHALACGRVMDFGTVDVIGARVRYFVGCGDGTFETGDLAGGQVERRRFGDDAPAHLAYGSAFRPGREEVVIGSNKGEAALVDVTSGEVLRRTNALTGVVTQVAVSPDGEVAVFHDEQHGAAVWDLVTGAMLGRLPASEELGFRFLATGPRRLATWGASHMSVWDLPRGRPASLPLGGGVSSIDPSPDGQRVAVAATQEAQVYDLADGRRRFDRHFDWIVKSVAWTTDGAEIAVGVARTVPLALVDVDSGRSREGARAGLTRRLARTPSGAFLRVFDRAPYELVTLDVGGADLIDHDENGLDLALTPDRAHAFALASATSVARIELGDARTAAPTVAFVTLEADCAALAPSPDGERLVCGDGAHLPIFDADGRLVDELEADPGAELVDVAWSPDDRLIAGGARDGTVYLWRVDSGRLAARVKAHDERASVLVFEPGGRWLYSGGWDDTLRTLDLAVLDAPPERLLEEAERAWGLSRALVEGSR